MTSDSLAAAKRDPSLRQLRRMSVMSVAGVLVMAVAIGISVQRTRALTRSIDAKSRVLSQKTTQVRALEKQIAQRQRELGEVEARLAKSQAKRRALEDDVRAASRDEPAQTEIVKALVSEIAQKRPPAVPATPRETARELWRQGYALHLQGKNGAVLYERAARADPTYAPAQNSLGVIAENSGDFAGAASRYEAALRLDPTYVPALWNLAKHRERQGQPEQAVDLAERILQLRPTYGDARNLVSRLGGRPPPEPAMME